MDAKSTFRPNLAAYGGCELTWDRDGFPSMGVCAETAIDTGWDTVKEEAQKTRSGVTAISARGGRFNQNVTTIRRRLRRNHPAASGNELVILALPKPNI